MSYQNPFDILDVARDLVRRDEADHLFDVVKALSKEVEESEAWDDEPDVKKGVLRGLNMVMDELDGRIGFFRERWG